jgi:hypothetical protein
MLEVMKTPGSHVALLERMAALGTTGCREQDMDDRPYPDVRRGVIAGASPGRSAASSRSWHPFRSHTMMPSVPRPKILARF